MKRFNLWLIMLFVSISTIPITAQTKQKTAVKNEIVVQKLSDTLKLEDLILYTASNGVFHFNTSITDNLPGFTGDSVFINYPHLFKMNEGSEMRPKESYNRSEDYKTFRYDLYYKGLFAVFNAAHFVEENGRLTEFFNKDYDINIDTTNKKSKEEALKSVEELISKYRIFQEPVVTLRIFKIKEVFRLVYMIEFYSIVPIDNRRIILNADNLELLSNESTVKY